MTPKKSEPDLSTSSFLVDRRLRRERKLDAIEIPERYVTVTDELLGTGGFGAVYMADYNGRNAAAKVSSSTFVACHNGLYQRNIVCEQDHRQTNNSLLQPNVKKTRFKA